MKVQLVYPELELPESKTPRSEGVHVSNIIRSVAMHMDILKPQNLDDMKIITDIREISDPVARLRILIGLAWEEFYIPRILAAEGVRDHPGELELDGVFMSPDGDSVDVVLTALEKPEEQPVIHEVKATYKSSKVSSFASLQREPIDIKLQQLWMMQIKSYCKARGTRYAILHVLFICGDYSYPIRPELIRFHIEFEQEEIDLNWQMLSQHLKDIEGPSLAPTPKKTLKRR